MINYYTTEGGKFKKLNAFQKECWVLVEPPFHPTELHDLSVRFKIPIDFLTDSLDLDERSRYERDDDMNLILVNTPILNEEHKENEAIYITSPIGIIYDDDFILTISGEENAVFQYFIDGRVKGSDLLDKKKFILLIFEQIVQRYMTCLKKLNVKRHIIETDLYNSSKSSDLKQLLRIEKSLVYFVNSISSNDLLKLKMKRTNFLKLDSEELEDMLEDVIIDNGQALEMANVHTNILNSTMEAYSAIIANNLNGVIQRLTLITVILMVPTLIASYYGMNLKGLPFENSNFGFFYIILISIILSLLLAWFFRRQKLL